MLDPVLRRGVRAFTGSGDDIEIDEMRKKDPRTTMMMIKRRKRVASDGWDDVSEWAVLENAAREDGRKKREKRIRADPLLVPNSSPTPSSSSLNATIYFYQSADIPLRKFILSGLPVWIMKLLIGKTSSRDWKNDRVIIFSFSWSRYSFKVNVP